MRCCPDKEKNYFDASCVRGYGVWIIDGINEGT